jgi:hypothetical protein
MLFHQQDLPRHAGPYNNCGVPGAKVFICAFICSPAGIAAGTANPYYVRFAPVNGTTSVAYAVAQANVLFFMDW